MNTCFKFPSPTSRKRLAALAASIALLASSLLAGDSNSAETSARKRQPFTFVQMCDTQLGMGGYEHDVMTFKLAVKQINAMKPDFVVICGDLVQTANDKSFADFNSIKAGFKLPCHCAAGNHDVGNKPTPETLRRYRETVGKDYYSFENKGYTFVVANTQLWKAPLAGESEKHDAWFKKTLETARKKKSPAIIVVHYPLFVKEPNEKEIYYNIPQPKRREILDLCEENGVVAFLAGHTHKLITNEYKGIQLVNGETTSKNFDKRPMGFRLWNAGDKQGLRHRFIKLEGMPAPEPASPLKNSGTQ